MRADGRGRDRALGYTEDQQSYMKSHVARWKLERRLK